MFSSYKKSWSGKARAFVGKKMDSEGEYASEEAEVESEEESDSGVASLALATAYVAKSIFNTEDNGSVTNADANDKDDSATTYCFMARGAKVNSRDAYFQTSSEDDSDCESKPSYKTLAKIATKQQKAMEHIQKLLDKSDDLLDAEMTQSQSLIEDIKIFMLSTKSLKVVMSHSQQPMKSFRMIIFRGSKNLRSWERLMKIFKRKTSHFALNRSVPLRKVLNHHV